MSHHPSLSAFLLCYNDESTIAGLLRTLDTKLQAIRDDYSIEVELLVVNDGSTDTSQSVLSALIQELPHLRIITHAHNQGYGAAVQSGFRMASKEFVFYTDGDGQYDPAAVETLYRALTGEVDVVQGYKKQRHDPLHRIVLGDLYRRGVRLLLQLKTRDINCDCRLIRRALWLELSPSERGGAIGLEMVTKLERCGAVFAEVPVDHYERASGSSQFFRVRNIALLLLSVLRIWWGSLTPLPINEPKRF